MDLCSVGPATSTNPSSLFNKKASPKDFKIKCLKQLNKYKTIKSTHNKFFKMDEAILQGTNVQIGPFTSLGPFQL